MTTTLQAPPRPKTLRRTRPPVPHAAEAAPSPWHSSELVILGIFVRLIVSLLLLGLGLRLLAEGQLPICGIAAPMLGHVLIGIGLLGVFLGRAFFLSDPLDKARVLG